MSVQKKWMKGAVAALLVLLVFAGFAVVAAEYGSSEDPLVSFSYITDVLMPNLSNTIDQTIEEKTRGFEDSFDRKISDFTAEMDNKIAGAQTGLIDTSDPAFIQAVADAVIAKMGTQGTGAAAAETYRVVDVPNGKTLTGKVGTELLLRIGGANCVASSSPGLIDLTTATDLGSGKAMQQNHLYVITVDGRGMKATSDVKVLVRGEYTIS